MDLLILAGRKNRTTSKIFDIIIKIIMEKFAFFFRYSSCKIFTHSSPMSQGFGSVNCIQMAAPMYEVPSLIAHQSDALKVA